jgi:hypothetical protein
MPEPIEFNTFVDHFGRHFKDAGQMLFDKFPSTGFRFIEVYPVGLAFFNVIEECFAEFRGRSENQACKAVRVPLQVSILLQGDHIGHHTFPTRHVGKHELSIDIGVKHSVAKLMGQAEPITVRTVKVPRADLLKPFGLSGHTRRRASRMRK